MQVIMMMMIMMIMTRRPDGDKDNDDEEENEIFFNKIIFNIVIICTRNGLKRKFRILCTQRAIKASQSHIVMTSNSDDDGGVFFFVSLGPLDPLRPNYIRTARTYRFDLSVAMKQR